jgi:hypothetical protein
MRGMNKTARAVAALFAVALCALLAACGGSSKRSPLEEALYHYTSAIRWSEFDKALSFVDPQVLAQRTPSDLEMERYKQYQVSGYDVRRTNTPEEGSYEQTVEIRLVNRHTQVERIITDHQRWRWDKEAKRWWLVSGLPDISQR